MITEIDAPVSNKAAIRCLSIFIVINRGSLVVMEQINWRSLSSHMLEVFRFSLLIGGFGAGVVGRDRNVDNSIGWSEANNWKAVSPTGGSSGIVGSGENVIGCRLRSD